MNHDELVNVLKIINTASVNGKSKDDATATVLRLAAESFTKDILRSLMEAKNIDDKNGNALTTEKESQMLIEAKGVSITKMCIRDRFLSFPAALSAPNSTFCTCLRSIYWRAEWRSNARVYIRHRRHTGSSPANPRVFQNTTAHARIRLPMRRRASRPFLYLSLIHIFLPVMLQPPLCMLCYLSYFLYNQQPMK